MSPPGGFSHAPKEVVTDPHTAPDKAGAYQVLAVRLRAQLLGGGVVELRVHEEALGQRGHGVQAALQAPGQQLAARVAHSRRAGQQRQRGRQRRVPVRQQRRPCVLNQSVGHSVSQPVSLVEN